MLTQMYDSVTVSEIPAGAQAVAGYVGGSWPDYSALVAAFPRARHKSVAVNALEDAEILDVEIGDAVPGEAPDWIRRQIARGVKRPGVYANASTMPAVEGALNSGGIPRADYVLWVAEWTYNSHIPSGFEACQWTDQAWGRNLDQSACEPSFWAGVPAPPVVNPRHYEWFGAGPYPSKWGMLDERKVVTRYDGARKRPRFYALYLRHLRAQLEFLAHRVAHEANHHPVDGRSSWGVYHRGWRYQQLIHRAHGQRFE